MKSPGHIVVFRFSAMGDVALVLPALARLIARHPELRITLVTRKKFAVFFKGYSNINVFEADFDGRHKGLPGLLRLFRDLKKLRPDFVADLHQNIRTAVLKTLFGVSGVPCSTINKGRKDKKALTRKDHKIRRSLPHAVDRYLAVFSKARLNTEEQTQGDYFNHSVYSEEKVQAWLDETGIGSAPLAGLAPFAQHEAKIWPLVHYKALLIKLLEKYPEHTFLLFGGGDKEKQQLDTLAALSDRVINLVGRLSLEDELTLISRLKLMICGDSSNMHLAALSGVPVVSIWGATHSDAGFGPVGQPASRMVQVPVEDLPCRPCSVYGNKPCFREDYACLHGITPEAVLSKAEEVIE